MALRKLESLFKIVRGPVSRRLERNVLEGGRMTRELSMQRRS